MLAYFYPRSPCGERPAQCGWEATAAYFYPRSPCGERQESQKPRHYARRFLSTLSLRRATGLCPAATPGWTISIHALLAESDLMVLVSIFSTASISIHALLAESDRQKQPVRHPAQISIHALLAESDAYFLQVQPRLHYFYPRSPCGERPGKKAIYSARSRFLSTLSLRRATRYGKNLTDLTQISIHALLAESDHASM